MNSSNGLPASLGSQTVVAAIFGRRELHPDPAWELEFGAFLRQSERPDYLLDLFSRFRTGETKFDAMMRRVLLRALCKHTGSGITVEPNVVLKHPETMEFGDCVFLGAQCMIQGRAGGTCQIGSHVWLGPQTYFDARNLVVEDYVGCGPGAKVLGSVHTGQPIDVPLIATSLEIKPVRLGFGADIGMNANILPGVSIGAHSIVGAGAVVTHDVLEYAIVAGVPARVLRDRREAPLMEEV